MVCFIGLDLVSSGRHNNRHRSTAIYDFMNNNRRKIRQMHGHIVRIVSIDVGH